MNHLIESTNSESFVSPLTAGFIWFLVLKPSKPSATLTERNTYSSKNLL